MPDNKDDYDWLSSAEARFDERLYLMLSATQRDDLNMLMRGDSIGGVEVDLDALECEHDSQLWRRLTPAQQSELELIGSGKSTNGVILDLDRLEESAPNRVG